MMMMMTIMIMIIIMMMTIMIKMMLLLFIGISVISDALEYFRRTPDETDFGADFLTIHCFMLTIVL